MLIGNSLIENVSFEEVHMLRNFNNLLVTICLCAISSSAIAQWEYVNPPDPYYGVNYVISHDNELYVATNNAVQKTADGGDTWTDLTESFTFNPGNSNRHIQFAGDNIFVSSTLQAVLVSPDNGSTWQLDTTGLESSYQADLLYVAENRVFGSMGWPTYGLYAKEASPGAWARVNSNSIGSSYHSQVMGMTSVDDVLYAATRLSGLYSSTDNGTTWTGAGNAGYPNVDGYVSNRLVSTGSDLFVASDNGVFKSVDQGDSWVRVDEGFATWNQFGVTSIMCLHADGGNLYASVAHDDSAYVSTDAGSSWSDISDGSALTNWIKSFGMHDGNLYACQWDIDSALVKYDMNLDVRARETADLETFSLGQNYPNPFNPMTTITYTIHTPADIRLTVYNIFGQRVMTVVDSWQGAGEHEVLFDGSEMPSGIYLYSLEAGDIREVRRMVLLK